MSFGLTNAPAFFQDLMNKLFGAKCAPYVGAYLDDIYIATASFEEHLYWLEYVIKTLKEAGLIVNAEKCDFSVPSVVCLGFRIDHLGLRPDGERIQPILEYPPPENLTQLRRFLGMVRWYARFIPDLAEIKLPLNKLLHKNVEWNWKDEQQKAFEKLKEALMTAPILSRLNFEIPFVLQTDASSHAVAGVLTQEHVDGEHVVAYMSRVLQPTKINY